MIRTLLMYSWAFVASLIEILPLLLLRKPYGKVTQKAMYYWTRPIFFFGGVKLNVTGLEYIDPNRSYVICSNHLHILDIPTLILASKLNIRFAAKKELFKVPLFGQLISIMGMIQIDRENRRSAVESLKQIAKMITENVVSVVLFPEGTRNKSAKGLLPFKKGAFVMAMNTETMMLPASINGSDKIFHGLIARPRTLNIHFHPPVDPNKYSVATRQQFMDDVYQTILSKIEDK